VLNAQWSAKQRVWRTQERRMVAAAQQREHELLERLGRAGGAAPVRARSPVREGGVGASGPGSPSRPVDSGPSPRSASSNGGQRGRVRQDDAGSGHVAATNGRSGGARAASPSRVRTPSHDAARTVPARHTSAVPLRAARDDPVAAVGVDVTSPTRLLRQPVRAGTHVVDPATAGSRRPLRATDAAATATAAFAVTRPAARATSPGVTSDGSDWSDGGGEDNDDSGRWSPSPSPTPS
jgi:hypothetical protein